MRRDAERGERQQRVVRPPGPRHGLVGGAPQPVPLRLERRGGAVAALGAVEVAPLGGVEQRLGPVLSCAVTEDQRLLPPGGVTAVRVLALVLVQIDEPVVHLDGANRCVSEALGRQHVAGHVEVRPGVEGRGRARREQARGEAEGDRGELRAEPTAELERTELHRGLLVERDRTARPRGRTVGGHAQRPLKVSSDARLAPRSSAGRGVGERPGEPGHASGGESPPGRRPRRTTRHGASTAAAIALRAAPRPSLRHRGEAPATTRAPAAASTRPRRSAW